jgi:molybdopterin/thiamine biosynthesis adenylyltransferase
MLSNDERAVYEWQLDIPGFGEAGQEKLKAATVLISRVGGLGGVVAYELAAAGVGHLILAHGGNIKPSDLNRQLLMTAEAVGTSRMASAVRRLRDLNPLIKITGIPEHINEANVASLVAQANVVIDCAPLFAERFLMNQAAVRSGKPMIDCAVYELQAQLTTFIPGQTPCLACLYPDNPPAWKRRFPVFGAVSGALGGLAAIEAIKIISGLGKPLAGQMLVMDYRTMMFQRIQICRRKDCPVCGDH